jgi:hypothetical protein
MIGPNGFQMDPAKVKVIQDWPEPQKVKDIQSFLGFANFHRQYIYNYSNIVVLLTCLTQKNIPWNFDESCKLAFLRLKQAFISALVLTHYKHSCLLLIKMMLPTMHWLQFSLNLNMRSPRSLIQN